MIAIKRLLLRNFLSYGNYDTVIDFGRLSQCYISGANGSGKSSLLQSILWCLSGSTMHTKLPGSRIRHWWGTNDTVVSIEFMDGSELTRIRTARDTTELLYRKNGEDIISGTVSTTSNQQVQLNKALKFDYDVFCSSVFLSQTRQGWLKMSDQRRKQIFERIMGIDRVNAYATVSKQELDKIELKVQAVIASVSNQKKALDDTELEIAQLSHQQKEFEIKQIAKAAEKSAQADKLSTELSQIDVHDLSSLKAKWDIISKVNEKIVDMRSHLADIDEQLEKDAIFRADQKEAVESKLKALRTELSVITGTLPGLLETKRKEYKLKSDAMRQSQSDVISKLTTKLSDTKNKLAVVSSDLSTIVTKIEQWKSMDGTTCSKCEQHIPHEHANRQVDEYNSEIVNLTSQKNLLTIEINGIQTEISRVSVAHSESIKQIDDELQQEIDTIIESNNKLAAETQSKIDAVEVPGDTSNTVLLEKRNRLATTIKEAESKMESSKPPLTVAMAEILRSKHDLVLEQIANLRQEAESCLAEPDPFLQRKQQLDNRKSKITKEIDILEKQLQAAELVTEHTKYVHKAYSDRRKIKGRLIAENRPYINNRLQHYLTSVGLDIRMSLSESLGLESDLWGHEFQSGGESARAELSLAFSSFDLHDSIHGPQSNFMVLDEPDDGLDAQGIDGLINIIHNDLASRFDTIFIISHRDAFRSVFPNTITIEQDNRLSRIVEVT